jgi:hypothetical protein
MKKNNLNPPLQVQSGFKPTLFTNSLGPIRMEGHINPVEVAQAHSNATLAVNEWQAMDIFDEGLRQALIGWVNTTKEGIVVTNATGSTRSKTMNFQFFGNPSKDIVGLGDVGQFSVVFKYTTQIVTPQNSIAPNTLTF